MSFAQAPTKRGLQASTPRSGKSKLALQLSKENLQPSSLHSTVKSPLGEKPHNLQSAQTTQSVLSHRAPPIPKAPGRAKKQVIRLAK